MKMKTKAIGIILGIIVLWMFVVGGSLFKYFDQILERNFQLTELKWTYICYEDKPYVDIKPVDGGELFIASTEDEDDFLIDETGVVIADPPCRVQPMGGGYVMTSFTSGRTVIVDETGKKIETEDVYNQDGTVLSDKEAAPLLERFAQEGKLSGEKKEGETNYKVMKKGKILGIVEIGE